MSFFKKLLGIYDKSPEELEVTRIKKEQKQIEKKKLEEKRKIEFEEKRRASEAKKAMDQALQEKYIGPGLRKGFDFSIYKGTIQYFESTVLRADEIVLLSIRAEYDKTKKQEIKGLLIATDQRLVFVSSGAGFGQYFEEFDYRKMNGISHVNDGLFEKEIYIDLGRSRKKFDDIIPNERFNEFVEVVMQQINISRNIPKVTRAQNTVTKATKVDKYESLEKIAKLKEQGILTEEEFQTEKEKILNS